MKGFIEIKALDKIDLKTEFDVSIKAEAITYVSENWRDVPKKEGEMGGGIKTFKFREIGLPGSAFFLTKLGKKFIEEKVEEALDQ